MASAALAPYRFRLLAAPSEEVPTAPNGSHPPASLPGSAHDGNGRSGRPGDRGLWRWILAIVGGAVAGLLVLAAIRAVNGSSDNDSPPAATQDDAGTPTQSETARTPESTIVVAPADFSGTWHTNSSLLVLTQTGAQVTGNYQRYTDHPPFQTLKGTLVGRTLTGKYDERWDFSFTLSDDGKRFDGYWIGSDGSENEWCGTLEVQEQQIGCGYSGEWRVKGLPAAFDLSGETITITQFDDRATVRFASGRYGETTWNADFDPTTAALAAGRLTLRSGDQTLRYDLTFLVSEFKEWDAFKGTWREVSESGGQAGAWCAWRNQTPPPC